MNNRGITLIETIIAVAVLCVALLPLVSVFILGTKGMVGIDKANVAMQLARELMDEIKDKYWDEWNSPYKETGEDTDLRWRKEVAVPKKDRSQVGPDKGERRRGQFDDIDDYDGWKEGWRGWPGYPEYLMNINGKPYDGKYGRPDYTRYKRRVRVRYVQGDKGKPDELTELRRKVEGQNATNLKQVTVIVSWGGENKDAHKVLTSCCFGNYTREVPE